MKLGIPRKQSIKSDDISVIRVEKEAKRARKVAQFGEVSDKRGCKVSVENMARFEEKGISLISN